MSQDSSKAEDSRQQKRWLENIRPAHWKPPQPTQKYDLLVLGGGSAGVTAALEAASAGARVALAEKHYLGGARLNTGLVPVLALVQAARAAVQVRRAGEFGVGPEGPVAVHFQQVMDRVRRIRAELSWNYSASRLQSLGVDVFFGKTHFTGFHSAEAGHTPLKFKRAIIAAGSREKIPAISGLQEAGYLTTGSWLEAERKPERLAVLGDGPRSCELAQAFLRLGCRVILIVQGKQLLPQETMETSTWLQQILVGEGMEIVLDAPVQAIEERGSRKVLYYTAGGLDHTASVDEILVSTVAAPEVEGLGLPAAGVAYSRTGGIEVNEFLETSQPHIWAAGSVCAGFAPSPAAEAMARAAVRNALFPGRQRPEFSWVPRCVHTDPEIASVGATERELAGTGRSYETHSRFFRDSDLACLDGDDRGFIRIWTTPGNGRILGATLGGVRAGAMLSEWAPAFKRGMHLRDWMGTQAVYPAHSDLMHQLARQFERKPRRSGFKGWVARQLGWRR